MAAHRATVRIVGYSDKWMWLGKVRYLLACCMIALPLNRNWLASQSWRFVAHEVRVISSKKEALQALSITKNFVWNPLTFRAQEID
jgi:hypothetical protein